MRWRIAVLWALSLVTVISFPASPPAPARLGIDLTTPAASESSTLVLVATSVAGRSVARSGQEMRCHCLDTSTGRTANQDMSRAFTRRGAPSAGGVFERALRYPLVHGPAQEVRP